MNHAITIGGLLLSVGVLVGCAGLLLMGSPSCNESDVAQFGAEWRKVFRQLQREENRR